MGSGWITLLDKGEPVLGQANMTSSDSSIIRKSVKLKLPTGSVIASAL